MAATLLVLASAVAFTGGALVSWLISERRARHELDELEAQMRAKVEERYRAYVALERRIRGAMAAFDRSESDLRRRIHNQSESILALREALERHDGFDLVSAERELVPELSQGTDFLGLSLGDEPAPVAAEEIGDTLAQMDDWERKVEGAALRSTAELERQSATLLAITQHVQRLDPIGRVAHAREDELSGWKRKYAELERSLAAQSEALQRCLEELRPVASQVEHGEEALREQREGYEERLRARDEELGTLRRRAAELHSEVESLRGELEAAREELLLVCAERDSLDARLADETSRVRELEPVVIEARERAQRIDVLSGELAGAREQVRTAEARLTERTRAFEHQSGELEKRLVAADQTRESLVAELAVARKRLAALESELEHEREQARGAAEASRSELRAEREARERVEREREEALERVRFHADALADKERLVAERESQVEDLTHEIEQLRSSLSRTSESLQGEQSRIGVLMRELGDVRERYESRDSTLHEAQSVLDALRPMIETLEQKLTRS